MAVHGEHGLPLLHSTALLRNTTLMGTLGSLSPDSQSQYRKWFICIGMHALIGTTDMPVLPVLQNCDGAVTNRTHQSKRGASHHLRTQCQSIHMHLAFSTATSAPHQSATTHSTCAAWQCTNPAIVLQACLQRLIWRASTPVAVDKP